MCFSTAKWKREVIPEHKFDYVDVNDFFDGSIIRRLSYVIVFIIVIKNILVYVADLWTAYLLVNSGSWSSTIKPLIDIKISRWIFIASIICSFLLLIWEWRKILRVVKSRDIAYAYTCVGAYRYYCIRSYAHYCLFSQINNSRTFKDRVAFSVYFILKGWKRFLLAEAPRQVVNGITLVSAYYKDGKFRPQQFYEYSPQLEVRLTFALMTFSFCIWIASAGLLAIAGVAYLPLLCEIRGNLKEYVCHKIDKRLSQILLKKSRKRILRERREQAQFAKTTTSVSGTGSDTGRQPTLPQLGLDESEFTNKPTLPAIKDEESIYSSETGTDYPGYNMTPAPGIPTTTSVSKHDTYNYEQAPVGDRYGHQHAPIRESGQPPWSDQTSFSTGPGVPHASNPSLAGQGGYGPNSRIRSESWSSAGQSVYAQPNSPPTSNRLPPIVSEEGQFSADYHPPGKIDTTSNDAYGQYEGDPAARNPFLPGSSSSGSYSRPVASPRSPRTRPLPTQPASDISGPTAYGGFDVHSSSTGHPRGDEEDDEDEPGLSRYNDRSRYGHQQPVAGRQNRPVLPPTGAISTSRPQPNPPRKPNRPNDGNVHF